MYNFLHYSLLNNTQIFFRGTLCDNIYVIRFVKFNFDYGNDSLLFYLNQLLKQHIYIYTKKEEGKIGL